MDYFHSTRDRDLKPAIDTHLGTKYNPVNLRYR